MIPAPKPSITSVVLIALMGATAAGGALLVFNSIGLAMVLSDHPRVLGSLVGGALCLIGAVGTLFRSNLAYWLTTAGLIMLVAVKTVAMFTIGFQWMSLIWTIIALFLALEAVARVLGWLEEDEAPQVEGKSIVHDYLNASMAATHELDKMIKESPRRAVANLTSAMKSKKDQVRSGAARRLAAMGTASALPGTLKALKSDDYFVRKDAIGGIKTALEGEADDGFHRGVFDPLVAILLKRPSDSWLHTEVPSLLLKLDPDEAEKLLKSGSLMTIESEWLPSILDALNESGALPELEIIRSLLTDIESGRCDLESPDLSHAAILRALVAVKAPEAESILRRVIKEKPSLADKASVMLLELHGIIPIDVYCKLLDREEDSGIGSLSEEEQNFYAAMMFMNEWDNGGIQQYFTNFSADHARVAHRALVAINAPNAAELLRQVMLLFGKQGPPADREERVRRIDLMAPDFFEEVDRVQDEAEADESGLETLLNFYLLENADSFS